MFAPRSGIYILSPLILGIILIIFGLLNQTLLLLLVLLGLSLSGIGLFFAWFFRDPKRVIAMDSSSILAAADGTIILVEELDNEIKIAIRMSPFNVHINRTPVSGKITAIDHTPGKHQNVYFGNIENKNERNLTVIENEMLHCEVLQLTGSFARRIEVWINVDDEITQGEKFGIIRFGSQTNIRIRLIDEKSHLIVLVKKGDTVKAGISIIAEIKE